MAKSSLQLASYMRIPTLLLHTFTYKQAVPESITVRGFVYTLRRAYGFSKDQLLAEYRLRCR